MLNSESCICFISFPPAYVSLPWRAHCLIFSCSKNCDYAKLGISHFLLSVTLFSMFSSFQKSFHDTFRITSPLFFLKFIHFLFSFAPSSLQFSSAAPSCLTLWPHGPQHARPSLSITNSRSLLKLMSIESVMPSNHLILCRPLLLPPSIFSSIRVFSNESVLPIRWPKCWSFSFSIIPSKEHPGLIDLL